MLSDTLHIFVKTDVSLYFDLAFRQQLSNFEDISPALIIKVYPKAVMLDMTF